MKEWYKDKKFWIKEVNGDGSWTVGILVYFFGKNQRFYLKHFRGIEITSTTVSTDEFNS